MNKKKYAVVFDLDETIGNFSQPYKFWFHLKKFLNSEAIHEKYFFSFLDLFPEFLRTNILKILKYVKKKKISGVCDYVMIYTNNNGPNYWANIIRSALGIKSGRKRLDIDISKQYIQRLYFEQGKKCAISGVDITLGNDASLDRIDSALGYIKENVQWVHKDINIMKGTYSEEYFIEVCKNVCNFKDNR